jgi:DNA polymerase V
MPHFSQVQPCIPLPGFPLLAKPVPAGFPSPAADYYEERLSLDEHLIEHQEATFFIRVQGHSMTGFGIHDGDLLVVDRALDPQDSDYRYCLQLDRAKRR